MYYERSLNKAKKQTKYAIIKYWVFIILNRRFQYYYRCYFDIPMSIKFNSHKTCDRRTGVFPCSANSLIFLFYLPLRIVWQYTYTQCTRIEFFCFLIKVPSVYGVYVTVYPTRTLLDKYILRFPNFDIKIIFIIVFYQIFFLRIIILKKKKKLIKYTRCNERRNTWPRKTSSRHFCRGIALQRLSVWGSCATGFNIFSVKFTKRTLRHTILTRFLKFLYIYKKKYIYK